MARGSNLTYRDYVVQGYFLNTLENSEIFVPQLSPILLMAFAHKYSKYESRDGKVARRIRTLLELEPNFTWENYESFHAHFEQLRRLVFQGETMMTLGEYYSSPTFNFSEEKDDPPFSPFPKKNGVKYLKHHFPQPSDSNPQAIITQNNEEKGPVEITDLEQAILIPAAGNKGCDIVTFEKKQAIAIECKFSHPGSKDKLTLKQIKDKHSILMKTFQPHIETIETVKPTKTSTTGTPLESKTQTKVTQGELYDVSPVGKLKLTSNDIYFVVCAFRDVETIDNTELPNNTIVLGKQELGSFYSPSLISRSHFILDNLKKET